MNSGSEANDLAMFMARMYTGCMDTMVFRGAYHGASPTTMGLTSLGSWYYNYPSTTAIHKVRGDLDFVEAMCIPCNFANRFFIYAFINVVVYM